MNPTDQPQEWTPRQWVDKMSGRLRDSWDVYAGDRILAGDLFEEEAKRLCSAHNAALAAEREKASSVIAAYVTQLDECERQLLAAHAANKTLVALLEEVLSRTVNTPVYPDGPCLNKDLRDDIKLALKQQNDLTRRETN